MKLTIFGASGRTGQPLVEQALDRGHAVVAFVRDPSRLPLTHERLRVVQGDALDPAAVARAVDGTDAVLSALGHAKGSPPDLQARATEHIVAAMKAHGVRRIVSETGAGVADERDPPYWAAKAVRGLMRVVAGTILSDAEAHAEVLRRSGLDHTIVRAPRLTDAPGTQSYQTGYLRMGLGNQIPRADVAHFMLDCAERDLYVREAPMITA